MALTFPSGGRALRLCLLLNEGRLPAWQQALLSALEQERAFTLQCLFPAQLRAARATAEISCDVVLVFESNLLSGMDLPAELPRWVLVDAQGRTLGDEFPLLDPITRGQGIALSLLEQRQPDSGWYLRRHLHVRASSRYDCASTALQPNLLRLIRQAATDLRLEAPAAGHAQAPRPAGVPRLVWYHRLCGKLRHLAARLHAQFLTEYWRIGVVRTTPAAVLAGGKLPEVRWLTPDSQSDYWADPFPMPGDRHRLFCERMLQRSGLGILEMLEFDEAGKVSARKVLPVGERRHASFPNVVEIDGRCFGVAETVATRRCILHEVDATGNWQPRQTLLDDVAAADPALFRWQGRWWLAFTDVDQGELDNLCLYYADAPEGPWMPHANNPVKIDIRGARMAGALFELDGVLYRPAQDCLATYGAAVVLHRVDLLTPEHFVESEIRRLLPDARGACPGGLHTFNLWGDRIVIDGKRHGVNFWVLRRNLLRRLKRCFAPFSRSPAATPQNVEGKRVLVYIPRLRLGGGEISMLRLAGGLAALGYEVGIVSHGEPEHGIVPPAGVSFTNLDCRATLPAVRRLAEELRRQCPDYLLSAFPHTNIAAVMARFLAGTPTRCVLSEHAPLSRQIEQQDNWRYRILPRLLRFAYRRADALVAVSQGVRDDLQQLLGVSQPVEIIHNPVLAGDFSEEMLLPPAEPWLNDGNLQVVLSMSRLSEEKDLPTLLRAFALVHRQRPSTRLLLAGEGSERGRLEALVRELALDDVVRLPGRVATPLSWMRQAAVFVLASRFEGFGNVLVEAMACGTPVVSTDCPVGPREILDDGRLGRLVPVGDAEALAQAIMHALESPQPPAEAAIRAQGFTQQAAATSYQALFARLAAKSEAC